jgi:hypothetical protein
MLASSKQVLLLAVVAAVACLAPPASATVFMVGDGLGWRAKFNETHWADNKTFTVGDILSRHTRRSRQHHHHAHAHALYIFRWT